MTRSVLTAHSEASRACDDVSGASHSGDAGDASCPWGDQSIDRSKRRAMKSMLRASALPIVAGMAPAAMAALSNPQTTLDESSGTQAGESAGPSQTALHDLSIHIYSSTAVPEDTLLISNHTGDALTLSAFMPGLIIANGKYLDLRTAIGAEDIVLHPFQRRAYQTKMMQLDEAHWSRSRDALGLYVWADDALGQLSDEAQLISVAGTVSNHRAILYANTLQSWASSVHLA